MATLILGALEEEIAACRERLSGRQDDYWHGFALSVGRLGESRVAVAGTGVGKTMSALGTQHWIDALEPERVIFVGTAGAVNPDIGVGDVVVATDALQYDLDARAAGLKLGRVPHTDYRHVESDPRLAAAALAYRPTGFRIRKGRALTGDRILVRFSGKAFSKLASQLGGDVVEMEGASVGLVCSINDTPFLLLRMVSDLADASASSDFKRFLPVASERLLAVVEHVLATVEGARGGDLGAAGQG